MPTRPILDLVRRHGRQNQPGAIVVVEQAVDVYAVAFKDRDARVVALDSLLRDLARLSALEPTLATFVERIERYVDDLHRDLAD
ncbi:hypothetical protein R1A27_00330 [Methylobacterium sp. NMS12]|uniref:hypothetical protein n=1 Tax=Methylobacterium sp. NMS12 TaxID=3079766 RepID=UPI003F883D60